MKEEEEEEEGGGQRSQRMLASWLAAVLFLNPAGLGWRLQEDGWS